MKQKLQKKNSSATNKTASGQEKPSGAKSRGLKIFCTVLVIYFLLAAVFFWASGDQLFYQQRKTTTITPRDQGAYMSEGTELRFALDLKADYLDSISLMLGTGGKVNTGVLKLEILDETGNIMGRASMNMEEIQDYAYNEFRFEPAVVNTDGKSLSVFLTAHDVPEGHGIGVWYGDSIDTGKFTIENMNHDTFQVGDSQRNGRICFTAEGRDVLWLGQWYWTLAGILGVVLAIYTFCMLRCRRLGVETFISRTVKTIKKYSFLVRQLVSRDFSKKYKRSMLGVFWSFLNPLLTMMVQYFIFSTLFKSNIENFVVYLLSGIIIFNFFSESVGLGLTSIVENANLINKVYMPKYIYPLSRVLSSLINLMIAMLPLLLVSIFTGIRISKAMLLMPFGILCLVTFSLGLALMLSSLMVFFKDIMFLWNVISTLWMYLTPIFYPVDIIPQIFMPLYKMNPLYQYITFIRTILLQGVAPSPENYLGCILSAGLMLLIGSWIFKKNENKFALYL